MLANVTWLIGNKGNVNVARKNINTFNLIQ